MTCIIFLKHFIQKVNVSISTRLYYAHLPSTTMTSFVEKQLHLLEIEHLAEIDEKNFETANLSLKVLQRQVLLHSRWQVF